MTKSIPRTFIINKSGEVVVDEKGAVDYVVFDLRDSLRVEPGKKEIKTVVRYIRPCDFPPHTARGKNTGRVQTNDPAVEPERPIGMTHFVPPLGHQPSRIGLGSFLV